MARGISPTAHIRQDSEQKSIPDLRPPEIKNQDSLPPPVTIAGPRINDRPTTIILLEPSQLASTPLLKPLQLIINDAFHNGHLPMNILGGRARLATPDQLPVQIGSTKGTFTYVVTYADISDSEQDVVLGTVSARPFTVPVFREGDPPPTSTFVRLKAPVRPDNRPMEMWELKLMAVDPGLQRQGMADFLLKISEVEVKRRAATDEVEMVKQNREDVDVVMVLTTIKELVGEWYGRRGYVTDYEVWNDPGYMGTAVGFTNAHMSKVLD